MNLTDHDAKVITVEHLPDYLNKNIQIAQGAAGSMSRPKCTQWFILPINGGINGAFHYCFGPGPRPTDLGPLNAARTGLAFSK